MSEVSPDSNDTYDESLIERENSQFRNRDRLTKQ